MTFAEPPACTAIVTFDRLLAAITLLPPPIAATVVKACLELLLNRRRSDIQSSLGSDSEHVL